MKSFAARFEDGIDKPQVWVTENNLAIPDGPIRRGPTTCKSTTPYLIWQEEDQRYIEWDLQCWLESGHPYPAVPHEAPSPVEPGKLFQWEDRTL